jgi:hypothetical protein
VTLVDTNGKGVQYIDAHGPVVGGVSYPVDVLVFATGFEFCKVGTFNSITGRDGVKLGDKWSDGESWLQVQQLTLGSLQLLTTAFSLSALES